MAGMVEEVVVMVVADMEAVARATVAAVVDMVATREVATTTPVVVEVVTRC